MSIRRDILKGVRIFWSVLFVLFVVIMLRIGYLQYSDMSDLSQKATHVQVKDVVISANRGQIYANNEYVLACSLSYFDLYMDCLVPKDSLFYADIGSLGKSLATLFKDKSAREYVQEIKDARGRSNRFKRLGKRSLTYVEAEQVKKFSIFKEGQYKGGIILKRNIQRYRPFGMLGKRTIGRLDKNQKDVAVGTAGLEEAYESELKGVDGTKRIERASRYKVDYVLEDPVDGNDVYTTIDVDMQDVASEALLSNLEHFEAKHGTAVVMEVATGEIKAMANIGKGEDGVYRESLNYSVEHVVEPGSVFKLASMIALLEDGKVRLTDSVKTGRGVKRFYNRAMRDFHACGTVSVQEVFEKSSNVGVSMLVNEAYKDNPQKYIDRLYDLHLGDYLDLEIKGEGKPYIKEPSSENWSGISLPWISIGYEVLVSPMHILTLYNAVANDGVMVKPKLVTAIKQGGELVRDFSEPIVIDDNICSKETLKKLKLMMEGVVLRGTAKNLRDTRYQIAGKTGTAHIAKETGGYDNKNYRATFVGYFPADNPKYSCIVMVEKPNKEIGRFGGSVAAPVLKKIADNLYAKGLITESLPLDSVVKTSQVKLDFVKTTTGLGEVCAVFGVPVNRAKKIALKEDSIMPKVVGLSLRDALFVLEQKGVKVGIEGQGYVKKQSVKAGEKVKRGEKVTLFLG